MDDSTPQSRRGFFREGFGRMLAPLANLIERRMDQIAAALPEESRYLRPPGAIQEEMFLQTCLRCGSCSDVCPVNAIVPLTLEEGGTPAAGTPAVIPGRQACVVCEELACMHACPSGALRLVELAEIRMGLAQLYETRCLRSNGEDCRICVEKCPLGETAIRIDQGRIDVRAPGCVGCGVCEMHCPTAPRAIAVGTAS